MWIVHAHAVLRPGLVSLFTYSQSFQKLFIEVLPRSRIVEFRSSLRLSSCNTSATCARSVDLSLDRGIATAWHEFIAEENSLGARCRSGVVTMAEECLQTTGSIAYGAAPRCERVRYGRSGSDENRQSAKSWRYGTLDIALQLVVDFQNYVFFFF